MINQMKKCWSFFKVYKLHLCISYILKIGASISKIIVPMFFGYLVNSLIGGEASHIISLFLLLISLYLFDLLCDVISSQLDLNINRDVNINTKNKYMSIILNLRPTQLKEYSSGKLYTIISNDTSSINTFFITILNATLTLASVIGIAFITIKLNYFLALLIIGMYPITVMLNNYYKKKVRTISYENSIVRDSYVEFNKAVLSNTEDIFLQNGKVKMTEIFDLKTIEFFNRNRKVSFYTIAGRLSLKALGLLNYFLITGLGLFLVYSKKITLGEVIAFNSYSKLLTSNLNSIISLSTTLQPVIVSLNRLCDLDKQNDLNQSNNTGLILNTVTNIKLEELSYSYKDREVFDSVSFNFSMGEIYGVKGENGSGKTTLARLLASLTLPKSGRILLNNANLLEIEQNSLGDCVLYFNSDNILYNISVSDNLFLFDSSNIMGLEDVYNFLNENSIDLELDFLFDNFEMNVSKNASFSSGQIQKILTLRGLMRDTPILIFDEAFSYMDKKSKELIKKYLVSISKRKIILIISHDESDYDICTKTILIENKKIVKKKPFESSVPIKEHLA